MGPEIQEQYFPAHVPWRGGSVEEVVRHFEFGKRGSLPERARGRSSESSSRWKSRGISCAARVETERPLCDRRERRRPSREPRWMLREPSKDPGPHRAVEHQLAVRFPQEPPWRTSRPDPIDRRSRRRVRARMRQPAIAKSDFLRRRVFVRSIAARLRGRLLVPVGELRQRDPRTELLRPRWP